VVVSSVCRPANLAKSKCLRMHHDNGLLTEIVELDGSRKELSREDLGQTSTAELDDRKQQDPQAAAAAHGALDCAETATGALPIARAADCAMAGQQGILSRGEREPCGGNEKNDGMKYGRTSGDPTAPYLWAPSLSYLPIFPLNAPALSVFASCFRWQFRRT
jgi:hypothetical protein